MFRDIAGESDFFDPFAEILLMAYKKYPKDRSLKILLPKSIL